MPSWGWQLDTSNLQVPMHKHLWDTYVHIAQGEFSESWENLG